MWKTLRKTCLFGLVLLGCVFAFSLKSENANAQAVNSFLSLQYYYQNNHSGDWILNTRTNTGLLHTFNNVSSGSIRVLNGSAGLPNSLSGSKFTGTGDIYFTFMSNNTFEGGFICPSVVELGIQPEQGTVTSIQSNIKSCGQIDNNGVPTWKISIQSAGSLSQSTTVSSFFFKLIGTPSDPFIDFTSIPGTNLQINVRGEFNFVMSTDPNTTVQGEINQNITNIYNQGQESLETQNEIRDWLKDDTPPNVDSSGLAQSAGWLPAGPVDSILTIPITLLTGVVNVFTNPSACQAVQLPLPFVNTNIDLPCVGPILERIGIAPLWNIVGAIIGFFLIWNTYKWLYEFVDKTLTFRENNSSIWGGL